MQLMGYRAGLLPFLLSASVLIVPGIKHICSLASHLLRFRPLCTLLTAANTYMQTRPLPALPKQLDNWLWKAC